MIEYKFCALFKLEATYGPLPIYASLTYILFPFIKLECLYEGVSGLWDFRLCNGSFMIILSLSLLHNLSQT